MNVTIQNIKLIYVPLFQHPVTSIKSGHNDKRIFVAMGNQVHVGWITSPSIAYLQLLNRLAIWKSLRLKRDVESLPLPCSLQNLISLLSQYLTSLFGLAVFVVSPTFIYSLTPLFVRNDK